MTATVASAAAGSGEPSVDANEPSKPIAIQQEISQCVFLMKRYIATSEKRFITRVIRNVHRTRRLLSKEALQAAMAAHFPPGYPKDSPLYAPIHDACSMEIDGACSAGAEMDREVAGGIEMYIGLLELVYLLDSGTTAPGCLLAEYLVRRVAELDVRALDPLAAKIYFYYSRFYELAGPGPYSDMRNALLSAYRSRSLRCDEESQAVLVNLLLRNYIHHNLYDQAEKFVSKITYPAHADNNQVARFMYYLGRIYAVQLDYSASYKHLLQAIRKAPQGNAAPGFQQSANKLAIIVQLLMGEIPDRSLFRQKVLQKPLKPYFAITQAVRKGDLAMFEENLLKYADTLQKDKNYTLVIRLRHNVIKAGIRLINAAYSRISFVDICAKLSLSSPEDAEFIVAKTIRDGVIEATVDREAKCMRSREMTDVYSTMEPQNAYFTRTSFCLALHDEALQAMRYPDNLHRKDWKSSRRVHLDFSKELESSDEMDGEF